MAKRLKPESEHKPGYVYLRNNIHLSKMAAPMVEIDVGKFVHIKLSSNCLNEAKVEEPYPRSGHCCATDGINLFVYGGYHPEYHKSRPGRKDVIIDHQVFTEMWCFNLATETWHEVKTVGEVPHETASMSMLLSGHTLLLFGGTCFPWGKTSNANIISFNLREKRWSALTCDGEQPPGKYGQAMSLQHNRLFLFGGCRKVSSEEFLFDADLHCLDLRNLSWTLLSCGEDQSDAEALSRVMYRHSLAFHENKIYVIGNSWRELYSSNYHKKIHVYNLETNTWGKETTLPCTQNGFPKRRQYHSCVQWKNEVYVCGGHNHQEILDDLWKLELPSLQWSLLPTQLPVPTFFHTAAITSNKCMYVFGGVTSLEDKTRTNNVFRIWLALPSLVDIALRKVLSLLPDRSRESIARLRELGLPRNILDRLTHVE